MPIVQEESVKGLLDRFLQTRRPEDFEPVIRLCAGQLYWVIYRIVHNQYDAEDLVQDTMLRAYEHIDTFQGNAKFSTWLCQIGVNLAISFLRRKKRHLLSDSVESDAAWPDERAGTAEVREEVARVHRAIARLSTKLRAVLVLSVIEEMPIDEIAQVLKCPKPTVYWRLHQARRILRRTLEVGHG